MDKYGYRYIKLLSYSALVFIGRWLFNHPDYHLIGFFVIALTLFLLFKLLVQAVAEDCFADGFDIFSDYYDDQDNDEDDSYHIVIFIEKEDDENDEDDEIDEDAKIKNNSDDD